MHLGGRQVVRQHCKGSLQDMQKSICLNKINSEKFHRLLLRQRRTVSGPQHVHDHGRHFWYLLHKNAWALTRDVSWEFRVAQCYLAVVNTFLGYVVESHRPPDLKWGKKRFFSLLRHNQVSYFVKLRECLYLVRLLPESFRTVRIRNAPLRLSLTQEGFLWSFTL